MSDREHEIRRRLVAALQPSDLLIEDKSHLHAGHEGAKDGRGHFDLTIVSTKFAGVSRIQRHQMVYDALGNLLESDIHAVRIKALTRSER